MVPPPTPHVLTAAAAHADALAQARVLVGRVAALVAARAAAPPPAVDWGDVGGVAEVNRRLAAVAALLARGPT